VLQAHTLCGFDASAFIYFLEGTSAYTDLIVPVFDAVESGSLQAVTSAITIMELTVKPLRIGRPDIADEYRQFLDDFPHLSIIELSRDVIDRGTELRASHGLRVADALQIAACLTSGATAFVTNDLRLRRIQELEIIMLNDFPSP
jgi:predicted nucleic acid-binding protein